MGQTGSKLLATQSEPSGNTRVGQTPTEPLSHAQPEKRPSFPHWLSPFTGVFVPVNGETTFLNLKTAFDSAVIRLAFFKKPVWSRTLQMEE